MENPECDTALEQYVGLCDCDDDDNNGNGNGNGNGDDDDNDDDCWQRPVAPPAPLLLLHSAVVHPSYCYFSYSVFL